MSNRNIGPLKILPLDEFKIVSEAVMEEKVNLIMAGYADFDLQQLILFRADGTNLIAPFSIFKTSGTGLVADFENLEFVDYGHTIKLGEYEASSDSILCELDPYHKENGNRLIN